MDAITTEEWLERLRGEHRGFMLYLQLAMFPLILGITALVRPALYGDPGFYGSLAAWLVYLCTVKALLERFADVRLLPIIYAGVWGRGFILVICVVLTGGAHSPFLITVPAAVVNFAMLGAQTAFYLRACAALWISLVVGLALAHAAASYSVPDSVAVALLYWVTVVPGAAISANLRRVNSLALRDAVTGLTNHRYFREALRVHAAQAERYDKPLSLLMIDLDDFKKFNDRYGHPAGDTLLRELGELLARACRGGDIVSRYGGEEFSIILPETPIADALAIAERLRQNVAVRIFSRGPVRISVGVATYPNHADSAESLLSLADNALYEAKWGGKNRVVLSGSTRATAATAANH